jgi:hypothetical protein
MYYVAAKKLSPFAMIYVYLQTKRPHVLYQCGPWQLHLYVHGAIIKKRAAGQNVVRH